MAIWPGNPPAFSAPTFDENKWRQYLSSRGASYRPFYQTPEEMWEKIKPKTPYEGWTLGGKAWGEVA